MEFIDIEREFNAGDKLDASSLVINSRTAPHQIEILGALQHGSRFRPKDTAHARRLLQWLLREFPDLNAIDEQFARERAPAC